MKPNWKTRTQYRILQVDRSCQDELKLVEDPVVYSYDACMLRIRQLEVLHSPEGGLVRKSRYAALLGMDAFSAEVNCFCPAGCLHLAGFTCYCVPPACA